MIKNTTETDTVTELSFVAHKTLSFRVGKRFTFEGQKYQITKVTPTKINTDQDGLPVDWPGFEVSAVLI